MEVSYTPAAIQKGEKRRERERRGGADELLAIREGDSLSLHEQRFSSAYLVGSLISLLAKSGRRGREGVILKATTLERRRADADNDDDETTTTMTRAHCREG